MRTVALAAKITEEEEACFQAIQSDNPLVTRSTLGTVLFLLGALSYWQRKGQGQKLDPASLLVEVQTEQAKQTKKTKSK